ncbi:hypothetical protein ACXZ1K_15960 [Pedobacter sp. PWIIR3]
MKVYKEPVELSQYDKMRGDFKLLWPVVREAFDKKVWLYHKENQQWFTPEEFLIQFKNKQMSNYEVKALLQNMIIRDPRTGNAAYHKAVEKRIELFHKEMNELRQKGEAFLEKVVDYYQQKREK